MKQLLFIAAAKATTLDCEWAKISQRLLPRLCTYDERARDYRGKKRVLARIAGQMSSMMYASLKTDQEILSQVPPGELPPPMLYDREIHRKHQDGFYRSLKPNTLPRKILQLQASHNALKRVSSFSSSSRQENGQGSLKLPEKLEAGAEGKSQEMQARQVALQSKLLLKVPNNLAGNPQQLLTRGRARLLGTLSTTQ